MKQEKLILGLFKALPIAKHSRKKIISKEVLEQTIKKGYIFTSDVLDDYDLDTAMKLVDSIYGLDATQMNSAFHKSWGKVKNASMKQLIIEQLIHYITTYGFEELGIYNEESVYIPNEKLDIPELKDGISLMVIKGYTYPEIKEKVIGLLDSGIALKEDTLKEIAGVMKLLQDNGIEFNLEDIDKIKNKEGKIFLLDELNLVPENPNEFLRFILYKITDSTLVIKSPGKIADIKAKIDSNIQNYFLKYKLEHGLEKLSSIFLRYKPIFLAMKESKGMKKYINKLRKLAEKNHTPMKEDYLNSITAKIKRNEKINKSELVNELSKVNIFRKIRLAYALKYRTIEDADSILYRIRNGKSFVTDLDINSKKKVKEYESTLDVVKESIVKDLEKNVKGKTILIPKNIAYPLPSSQKQFTGVLPSGTSVDVDKDMLVGVHWTNVGEDRIDLDLSLVDEDGKLGWDAGYRNTGKTILFSGDVTDAPKPKGASELFYIKRANKDHLMILNYFNYDKDVPVPFNIIVAEESPLNLERNYVVNPNNVKMKMPTVIENKQMLIGLVESLKTKNRFYFVETSLGNSNTSSSGDMMDLTRKYILNFYKNMFSLNDLMKNAGANIVSEKSEDIKIDIDLTPENLEKDTIIDLIKSK